jgi:hypothetical protein
MTLVARILGLSLLSAALGVGLGCAFFGQLLPASDTGGWIIISLLLACAGGIIGAVAGAAREIVIAQRQRDSS